MMKYANAAGWTAVAALVTYAAATAVVYGVLWVTERGQHRVSG